MNVNNQLTNTDCDILKKITLITDTSCLYTCNA